ncbi:MULTISPECIES: transporter [Syntrophotalea]|uniref:Uncharacterized protein n=2 Tax=Syntrophotalea TaxID=2812025 RepID=Q71EW6_SYNAC|nr:MULTISPECIES: transporter [Syntrophotalea]AAQ08378.1 unknown [Syntrophotalea acetylenica]APG25421.1 hypothetical protein A7E75_10625 [Syntrophotalea acetylenica]APG28938.1 hypothetical protein A7E78_14570 [Syntrophotalea acetylenivorans]APG43489.1 hypothetical protein A6070_04630 [Syntrophotalea acetylenica]
MAVKTLKSFLFVVVALCGLSLVGNVDTARAGLIPYSFIQPHDFQLPIGKEVPAGGLDLYVSYNTYREEGKAWDGDSGTRSVFLNLNRYIHVWTVEGLDNWSFLTEGVVGLGRVLTKDDNSETGLLDTMVGGAAAYRTGNWTSVLEYFLFMPTGSDELSSNSWNHSLTYLTNYHVGAFTFDGSVGYQLKGDSKVGGTHIEQGDTFYVNTVFAYKFQDLIEPYIKVDYQTTESGKNKNTGDSISSQDELAVGIGNHFTLSDRLTLALSYEKGVSGRNTTKTNAGWARFIWVF